MKTVCDFCKTEYELKSVPAVPVRCAICGNVWRVQKPVKKNSFLVFFAALCALLSAILFTVVVVVNYQAKSVNNAPLTVSISEVKRISDEQGIPRVVVDGIINNNSENIYGVPDLMIISYDDEGNIIARQKFLPSATLLDVGDAVGFSHTLSVNADLVRRVSVELQGEWLKK